MARMAPARRFSGQEIGWELSDLYLARRARAAAPAAVARAAQGTEPPAGVAQAPAVVKIKEIVARVEELSVTPLPDQAVVQGVVAEQIFFVGGDGVVRERAVRTPFSHRLRVPGLDPERVARGEQTLEVEGDVAFVLAHLVDAERVKDKIVVQLTWTLTERTPVNGLLLDAVIGEGREQVLVVAVKEFPVARITFIEIPGLLVLRQQLLLVERKPLAAVKIKRVQAQVAEVRAQPVNGRVLVTGRVRKQVEYVGPDGIVRGTEETLPFSEVKEVPGLPPGVALEPAAEVEFVLAELDPERRLLVQKVVLRVAFTFPGPPVTVVSDVTGPGIVTTRVKIRVDGREEFVVTAVSGPGVKDVVKRTVFVDVVDDGNPNPVPLVVVVDLRVDP